MKIATKNGTISGKCKISAAKMVPFQKMIEIYLQKRYHLREFSPNLYEKIPTEKVPFEKMAKFCNRKGTIGEKYQKITNKTGTISVKSQNSATSGTIWEINFLFVEKLYLSFGKI